jgi:hypothetical protein
MLRDEEIQMQFLLSFAIIMLSLLASHPAMAQTSPEVGVWKLNLAKSKFYNLPTPKGETRTVAPQGQGVRVHQTGINADGSPIDFSYSYTYDDRDDPSRVNGVVVQRLDPHTFLGISRKDGKIVGTGRAVISNDGRTMTFVENATDSKGQKTGYTAVYEKQQ